ncbi:MAG: hypothetical protein CMN60_20200 [Sphingobium sp.]|nr:hypothetical protein [Sphingobium sp.]|tara:strand:- start:5519 stop:6586 length:1068 start_codon:yes stop_codon:yes gene_type:complete
MRYEEFALVSYTPAFYRTGIPNTIDHHLLDMGLKNDGAIYMDNISDLLRKSNDGGIGRRIKSLGLHYRGDTEDHEYLNGVNDLALGIIESLREHSLFAGLFMLGDTGLNANWLQRFEVKRVGESLNQVTMYSDFDGYRSHYLEFYCTDRAEIVTPEDDKPALVIRAAKGQSIGTNTRLSIYLNRFGKLHRDGDRPALVLNDREGYRNFIICARDGELHRSADEPALYGTTSDFTMSVHACDGHIHNEDGPAIDYNAKRVEAYTSYIVNGKPRSSTPTAALVCLTTNVLTHYYLDDNFEVHNEYGPAIKSINAGKTVTRVYARHGHKMSGKEEWLMRSKMTEAEKGLYVLGEDLDA